MLRCAMRHVALDACGERGSRQAQRPEMAAEMLAKHDAFVAAGGQPRRVSVCLAGQHGDTLRADLEAHANGRGMSARLSAEVCAYQLCLLDDTRVEAVRRDVPHISARSPASVVALRAATLRLDQSLAFLEENTAARAWLLHRYRAWTAILRVRPAKSRRGVKPKVKHRRVFEVVHRSG